ncbi:MAG: exonuclease SbcCD subunit D C-terminal domain-containing protein [Dysgonamonadaceae bacterium]|jgi:exonuclease SbcD|nr:exonuclease SbcCD subunit D C-terminal domain-containing protein [Dysgonamonadaceae bacterium]
MKLLHTSDWHLGRTLYSKKERQNEHAAFLTWLLQTIKENAVNLLLIAGDIFDTPSPSSASQKTYYDFLLKVRNSGCKNVIVIGGNHDSPSFLNAPKEILAAMNITVVGNASENIEEEVISIKNENGETLAIVCAVPFLRERDISRYIENETCADRSQRIAGNIKSHYAAVAGIAEKRRQESGKNIPLIATGHLSVAGGKTAGDDGVRETCIGNIECIGSEIFPETFDYVALGHYHIPSVIRENIRYCGSPIPMGFGEAEQLKSVYLVDFGEKKPEITTIEIPVFQKLKSIRGDKTCMEEHLSKLKKQDIPVWLEVIYEGNDVFPDFTAWAAEQTANTQIEILKLQNRQYLTEVLTSGDSLQLLDELDIFDVFDKLLDKNTVSGGQQVTYKELYNEIVMKIQMPEPDILALKESNGGLKESNERLKESNERLKESNEGLKESNERLKESNEGLKESNERLKESNEGLKESDEMFLVTNHLSIRNS